ncbi:MAG: LysM domain-containing protein [Cyanobacteriota bacterium]|nr:LysM domain-containing protein [Cyanobacteriota bacterium]
MVLLVADARADSLIVRVRDGDTLEAIGQRHGADPLGIARLNGLTDPDLLEVGQLLQLPLSSTPAAAGVSVPEPPRAEQGRAALLLSPAERRDRVELAQRQQSGQTRWKWYGDTAVDWSGWRLHPGGVRITLVKPAAADVGVIHAGATAVAVHCGSLRQTWRLDGAWEPWRTPAGGSVAQRVLLDLCSNTLDGYSVPVPPLPAD